MSKMAISAGTDSKGKWHVFAGPEVPYQDQKSHLKELVASGGKVNVKGEKGKVQLERWGLFIQTTKRYRKRTGLSDPHVAADIQV